MQDVDRDRWSTLEPHLDRVLELPETEREGWLTALAREAPDIAKALRSVLELRDRADFALFLSGSVSLAALQAADLAGQRVGAYVLEAEIGHGGMGSVWLARRADGQFEGCAALKFLNAACCGREGQDRFRREGQFLAQLDHANIARLLDAGVAASAQPYLVLEYVEGERIDAWCDKRRLDVAARIRLFLDVLSAVAHAHSHLILHRDIKPANILVTAEGTAKLLDFGIGRLLDGGEGSAATRAGGQAMTPEFAAPEQLRGGLVTTATDVYALGLVLYVLLAGRHPFEATTRSPAEMMHQMLETDPQRPSTAMLLSSNVPADIAATKAAQRAATPGGLRKTLRGDLDNILAKALRKDPAERYATVGAFAEDLRRHLTHQPVSARPDTAGYRATKFVRRHRGGVAASATFVVTLIAAAVVTTSQMLEARRQRDEAQYQSRRAESANEFLNVLLLSDGGPDRPSLSGVDRLELGVGMLESQYRDDPSFAGRMLVQLGRQFRRLLNTRRTVDLFERAYELGRASGDAELMALAQCAAAYAEALGQAGNGSTDRIVEAHGLMARHGTPGIALQIDCLQAEAKIADLRGDHATALAQLTDARRLLERTHNTHHAAYVSILTDIGGIYNRTNRLREALEMAELAGATHEKYGRGGTAARLVVLQNRAVTLHSLGEVREAYVQRLEINRRAREVEPAGAASFGYQVNFARVLSHLGRPAEAMDALGDVVERARRTGNIAWTIGALLAQGVALTQLGRASEAGAAFDEAAALAARNPQGNREILGRIEHGKAELELARGDLSAARRHNEAALKRLGYPGGTPVRATGRALLTAGEIALAEAHPAEAERQAVAALAVLEPIARGPETSADVGEALWLMARARLARGDRSGAQPLLPRAVRCLTNGLGADHALTHQAQETLAAYQPMP